MKLWFGEIGGADEHADALSQPSHPRQSALSDTVATGDGSQACHKTALDRRRLARLVHLR